MEELIGKRNSGICTEFPPQEGTELAEGDIVEFLYFPELQITRGIIRYKNWKFVVQWEKIMIGGEWVAPIKIYGCDRETELSEAKSYQILGNITQAPEFFS